MEQSTSQTVLRSILSFRGAGRVEKVMGATHTYRLEEQQTGATCSACSARSLR